MSAPRPLAGPGPDDALTYRGDGWRRATPALAWTRRDYGAIAAAAATSVPELFRRLPARTALRALVAVLCELQVVVVAAQTEPVQGCAESCYVAAGATAKKTRQRGLDARRAAAETEQAEGRDQRSVAAGRAAQAEPARGRAGAAQARQEARRKGRRPGRRALARRRRVLPGQGARY